MSNSSALNTEGGSCDFWFVRAGGSAGVQRTVLPHIDRAGRSARRYATMHRWITGLTQRLCTGRLPVGRHDRVCSCNGPPVWRPHPRSYRRHRTHRRANRLPPEVERRSQIRRHATKACRPGSVLPDASAARRIPCERRARRSASARPSRLGFADDRSVATVGRQEQVDGCSEGVCSAHSRSLINGCLGRTNVERLIERGTAKKKKRREHSSSCRFLFRQGSYFPSATNAIRSPRGLIASLVMPFTPAFETSAISVQPALVFAHRINFEPLPHTIEPSDIHA